MKEQDKIFIGKIKASVTHEFMNVLATIREQSSLMEDLLALDRETSFPHREKFTKTLTIICKQVNRGMEISARLNTFAHSMDKPEAQVEVNELLNQLSFLMQRSTRLKQVQLTVDPVEPPLTICIDPSQLQLTLVSTLKYCLGHTAKGGMITLRSLRTMQGIAFQSMAKPWSRPMKDTETLPAELSGLQETLDGLGARLTQLSTPRQQALELDLSLNPKKQLHNVSYCFIKGRL